MTQAVAEQTKENIVVENLWFLSGQTHIGILRKHGCRFWDPWADERGEVPSAYGNFGALARHVPRSADERRASGGERIRRVGRTGDPGDWRRA